MENNLKEFNSILENIISCSIEVNKKIKDLESDAENNIIIDIVESIDNIYKERYVLVEKLKSIFDETTDKDNLLKGNLLWAKYNEEILLMETQNMEFLNKKSIETKNKLTELSANKSLLIYNPKVKLSYENKLI